MISTYRLIRHLARFLRSRSNIGRIGGDMRIDENTQVLARFYPEVNNRGLNIYNPYFQSVGINAVYLLFHNEDPAPLIRGMRDLQIPGAIIAGSFERDPRVADLVDDLHPLSQKVSRVGLLVNRGGRILGVYQGAFGLDESIRSLTSYTDKKMVILGAGTVVKALLALMEMNHHMPKELEVYNRTESRAIELAREYSFITGSGSMEQMISSATGDIFVNATNIGSPWNKGAPYEFPEPFVGRFNYVVDVTFVPIRPQLIQVAEKLGKQTSPGHRMFLYQGKYALETILGIDVDEALLSRIMLADFETNWS